MGSDAAAEESAGSSRTGEKAQKSYRRILSQELEKGVLEIDRPNVGIALSGLSAGLDIGFGPLLMAMVLSTPDGGLSPLVREFLVASAYAIGFVFVVIGRSDLFTEHTTLALIPVLDREASLADLARLWGIIYGANLLGAVAFAALAVFVGPAYDVVHTSAFAELAAPLVRFSWWATLLAAVLAGWLMGLLSWLVTASRNTVGAIIMTWLVAMVIGYGHLPHSIAGTIEVLFGVFSGHVSVAAYLRFLVLSTIGNVVGGTVFVGLLKYGHATQGGKEEGSKPRNPAGSDGVGTDGAD
ncbi:MAG: formate/nitrite transporter family protein [Haloarculaceae archaeon]